MTGAGHAQHSKEATIVCGLERFHFISRPACPLPLPPWGSPRPQCLPASFATVHNARALGFVCLGFWFISGRFPSAVPVYHSHARCDLPFTVPAAAGHSKCSTTSADCTSTESHVFCFLTTAGSLSCTRKVSVAQQ